MGKFIAHLTGPISKYRLDIFMDASPDIREHVIFFTNKASYDYYKEYHDKLEFVFIDDYRLNEEISNTFEIFPDPLLSTEEEYYKNLHSFYKNKTQTHPLFWPHETRRFIFKYLLEKNILNFCIVGNNVIFKNDSKLIENYFNNIPPGYLYAPFHGEDSYLHTRRPVWSSIQDKFPDFKLDSPFLRTCDGFLRGHHFRNKEDMNLYFNIWNEGINKTLSENIEVGNNGILVHLEWVSSHVMQFFEHNKKYTFVDYTQLERVNGQLVLSHKSRPEDKLFPRYNGVWDYYKFDYSDITSVSAFIKNNKIQLDNYYKNIWGVGPFEITDNHVFTRIN